MYQPIDLSGKVSCQCGNVVGIDKGRFIKMIAKSFTCSGTKRKA